MTKEPYKSKKYNTTKQIKSGGIIGRLTGKNDLIFLRNRWQTEISNAYVALWNMSHYIETCEDSVQTIIR